MTRSFFKNGKAVGEHAGERKHTLFRDQEIIHVHEVVRKQILDENHVSEETREMCLAILGIEIRPIYVEFTANHKAIIQQAAQRGCTAAATAMLIVDHGKACNVSTLKRRNLGDTVLMKQDLEKAGLKPIITNCSSLKDLKKLIHAHGSAIISIGGEGGGHVIIVDAIESDRAGSASLSMAGRSLLSWML